MSKLMKRTMAAALCAGMMITTVGVAGTYKLDEAHTYIGFKVSHMVVSKTKGNFGTFDGTIEFDKDAPENISASATIDVASVDTDNQKRDDHLRSDDFFDVEQYPNITFETTSVEGTLPNVTLVGDLTIKGVTKEVSIPAEFMGPINDPWGNTRIGFSGETEINRKDFGITWNNVMDGGGLVVGETVTIILEVEAIKQ